MSNVSQQVSKFPKIEKFSLNALNDYKYVYVFYFIQELIIFSEIGYEFRFPYSNILVHWQMERKLVRYSYLLYDKKKKRKEILIDNFILQRIQICTFSYNYSTTIAR